MDRVLERHGRLYLFTLYSFIGGCDGEICIGDANGMSCSPQVRDRVVAGFRNAGFGVVLNAPFSGASARVMRSDGGRHGVELIQIESRADLYIDPDELDRNHIPPWDTPRFRPARTRIQTALLEITRALPAARTRPGYAR